MLNILNVAQSGLKASQTQVENVMNNLANENTPGYKKRVVDVSEVEHSDSRITGRGIDVGGVSRATNIYMYQNLIKSESTLSNTNQLNSMLTDVESIFYETETSGFSADLDRYFNSIENLRTSPQNEVYKNDVDNSAQVLVSDLQNLYENIEDTEKTSLLNIKENVGAINSILTEIGNISKKISDATGDTPNDLLDKRDSLEKDLATYIDVKISRESNYELKIAGVTAVRFDTNVHEITLVEEYKPQKDVYASVDNNGVTITPIKDSLIPTTWTNAGVKEVQEIDMSGTYDDGSSAAPGVSKTVNFLGTLVPTTMGADATVMTTDILADSVNIKNNWNKGYPEKEIDTLTAGVGDQVIITYKTIEGDVPAIDNASSNGINFTGSIETTKGEVDSLTYTLNNENSLTVTYGETIYKADGVTLADINNDGNNTNDIVNEDNALQAMLFKINQSQNIGGTVKAYNGQYELADDGSKILTNDFRHSDYDSGNPNKDRHLVIEAKVGGEKGSFTGEFLVNDSNSKSHQEKNNFLSKDGIDDIHLEIYDKEVTLSGGSVKALIENVKTDSGANIFNEYKDKLDQFAKTLSDLTSSYIENADQSYIYGKDAVEVSSDEDKKVSLNLFTGADVKSLKFSSSSLNVLTQDKLDYLATLQWKEDVDFEGTGLNIQSFSQFYQTLRVDVAANKEDVDFTQGAQEAVSESLQNAYDKVTKVDKDNEMIELIKYQSAYEANAKMVTLVDEMLQTLLNM
jgi:flagellar hook-associated protein FlgK